MAALTFGNIAAGTEGFYQGRALARKDETERQALEALRRQEALREMQAKAPAPAPVSMVNAFNGGQQSQMPVEQVAPPASAQTPVPTTVVPQTFRQALPGLGVRPVTSTPLLDAARQPVTTQPKPEFVPQATSPFGRWLETQRQTGKEVQAREALRNQIINRFGTSAGLFGFFKDQTDAERETAKQIMGNLDKMTPEEMQYVLETGQLPTKPSIATSSNEFTPVPTAPTTNFAALAAAVEQVESGGRVDAVSPKGALGPMQTMPETLRNPGFGIAPARDNSPEEMRRVGQEYLAAMLNKYNGNLSYALAAYNWGPTNVDNWISQGADPNKLPQETREYIPKVMAAMGQTPAAQPVQMAQAPTDTTTDVTAPTTGPVVPGPVAAAATPGVRETKQPKSISAFYAANPDTITGDQQILNGQYQRTRAEAIRKFQMAQQAGMGTQAEAIRDQIVQLDEAYTKNMRVLQGMSGVYQLEYGNDPRTVSAVMSYYVGQPVAFQPRSDGTFNMWVNGKKVGQPMTRAQVTSAAKEMFDEKYREAKVASQAKFGTFQAEEAVKTRNKLAEIQANTIKDTVVERVKGEIKIKQDALSKGWEIKPSNLGDGTFVLVPPLWMQQQGTPPLVYNPSGRTVKVDNVEIQDNSAIPITGLPSAVQIAGGK